MRPVQWMVEHQNPDGSWGTIDSARPYQIYLDTQASHDAFGGATSALGVMSLIEASQTILQLKLRCGGVLRICWTCRPSERRPATPSMTSGRTHTSCRPCVDLRMTLDSHRTEHA